MADGGGEPGEDDTGDDDTGAPGGWRGLLGNWNFFRAALFLTGVFGILALLLLDSGADYLVSVLSLLLAFVFGVLSLRSPPAGGGGGAAGGGTFWTYVANIAASLLLGLVVGGFVFWALLGAVAVAPAQAVRVTNDDQVALGEDSNLSTDSPATLVFTRPTPERRYLDLELSIRNNVGTGDCLDRARVQLVPRIGGTRGRTVEVETLGTEDREPSVTRIRVDGSVDDLSIDVMFSSNPGCRVELSVTGARFNGYVL